MAIMCLAILSACKNNGINLNYNVLNKRAAREYQIPIRPFKHGSQPCWNHWSRDFKFAPVFDFVPIDGCTAYRYTVWQDKENSYFWTTPIMQRIDDRIPKKVVTDTTSGYFRALDIDSPTAVCWSFTAKTPNESLAPIWHKIPVGNSRLIVEGLDGNGNVVGIAGDRLFIRDFPFEGPYPSNPRPYREAAVKAAMYVHNNPAIKAWIVGNEPDPNYMHNMYACKIIGATVKLEVQLARMAPEIADECITAARNAALFLASHSNPEGSPLAYFPPTYYKKDTLTIPEANRHSTMMMEASSAATAYLDLYDYTKEDQWLHLATNIARTYKHLQAEDGSLPVKVNFDTGKPVSTVPAMLHPLLSFLERLHNQYGITEFDDIQTKGEKWMQTNPLRTFDIRGQFEDGSVNGWKAYQNMTNSSAAPYASYLLKKDEVSSQDMEDAKDLLRFSEDQFVRWNALPNRNGFRQIHTPGVYEQFEYRVPVDNSCCNLAFAWLDLYELTGDKLAFAKAKALADAIAVVQDPINGQIPTTWDMRPYGGHVKRAWWINCSYASIMLMLRMAELTKEQ